MNSLSKFIAIGLATAMILIGALGLLFTFGWSPFNMASNIFVYQNNLSENMMMGGHGGGMMRSNYGQGGMMSGYYNQDRAAFAAAPAQMGATPAAVDQEIKINITALRFTPSQIIVKAGSTVRFVITNNDVVPHSFFSQTADIPYLALPVNSTQTLVWTAPTREGDYTALCTLHQGMILQIAITK